MVQLPLIQKTYIWAIVKFHLLHRQDSSWQWQRKTGLEEFMRKSNSYVHLSFDLVEEFVPRIPKSRLEKEDAVTPRICVAKYISQALSALPVAGKTIEAMLEIGMPVIIHAYYLQSDAVIQTEDLLEAVPDARYTGEMWITERPKKIWRVDYELCDIFLYHTKDMYGEEIVIPDTYTLKKVCNQDNWKNFLLQMKIKEMDEFREIMTNTLFSTMIVSMLPELKKIREKTICG